VANGIEDRLMGGWTKPFAFDDKSRKITMGAINKFQNKPASKEMLKKHTEKLANEERKETVDENRDLLNNYTDVLNKLRRSPDERRKEVKKEYEERKKFYVSHPGEGNKARFYDENILWEDVSFEQYDKDYIENSERMLSGMKREIEDKNISIGYDKEKNLTTFYVDDIQDFTENKKSIAFQKGDMIVAPYPKGYNKEMMNFNRIYKHELSHASRRDDYLGEHYTGGEKRPWHERTEEKKAEFDSLNEFKEQLGGSGIEYSPRLGATYLSGEIPKKDLELNISKAPFRDPFTYLPTKEYAEKMKSKGSFTDEEIKNMETRISNLSLVNNEDMLFNMKKRLWDNVSPEASRLGNTLRERRRIAEMEEWPEE